MVDRRNHSRQNKLDSPLPEIPNSRERLAIGKRHPNQTMHEIKRHRVALKENKIPRARHKFVVRAAGRAACVHAGKEKSRNDSTTRGVQPPIIYDFSSSPELIPARRRLLSFL